MNARLPLYERYMRDEERDDNRRMRRRDPIKAEREESFRVGLSGDWRSAEPGRPNAIRRRFAMFRAVRRERSEFRKAYRSYRRNDVPMADVGNWFAELGNRIMNSWLVLITLGAMCVWAILNAAGCFK